MPREVLLVTGASSDLGLALIRRVAGGTSEPPLVLAHHHAGAARIAALQAELGAANVVPLRADLSRDEEVAALAQAIESQHGPPTQVVHLPGLKLTYERFSKFDWPRFQRDMAIQLQSAIVLLGRFAGKMAKAPRARAVFVLSSVTRDVPPKFMSMYTVVKYAQLGLMRALAAEYAGTKLTVNAVSPSMVATRFLEDLPEVAVEMTAASSPHKRHATPDEVAGAIAFLLSPAADYISGAVIPVTAGSTS
jgi:3-oxoacyl-[acyl-carrier protein] reductase